MQWLLGGKQKSPYGTYEHLNGNNTGEHEDDDEDDFSVNGDDDDTGLGFRGSTYSPHGSSAYAVVASPDAVGTKCKRWWCGPSSCCLGCCCCRCCPDRDELAASGLFARWKVALAAFAVLLLFAGAVLCVFFLVAAPKIVQAVVDDCDMTFTAITLSDPYYTPDQQSFRMKATGTSLRSVCTYLTLFPSFF